ncbi:hypothetical protein RRG08_014300 [Elysia crispata]|uniref:DNA repair protein REV1 n=1 Tax=Elysia crispata TaxID=231223 RepID=A0AAE0Z1V0_9GAST|nr:hypothetical protein RRG08_014300 [Elysia crispata]
MVALLPQPCSTAQELAACILTTWVTPLLNHCNTSFNHGHKEFDDQCKGGYDFMVPKGSTGVQTFHSMAEIASCSYEARKAGVKNGMFMGRAMSLCPDLQTIPYNFTEYNRISKILYDLVASYTHDIEAVSCDEMLIDCTDVLTDTGATAMEFARLLRSEMMEKTGCPASTGIGPNVLLAKLATRRAKPNGQFEVQNSEAKQFIQDQPVSDLPGVGYSMTRKLSKLDVQTCGQLQHVPVSTLRREFGPKTGEGLHKYSFGQDDRPVKGDKQRKSVSAEVNYGIRFSKDLDALTFLKELAGEVKRRLDGIQVKGRCITLKLMVRRPDAPPETAKFMGHGICNTFNKSSNLPVATNDEDLIAREVISLYKSQKVIAEDVRGIGIQINKLENSSSNPRGLTSIKGHQSILNFAVPSCSKINPGQNFSGEGSKPKSAGLTHQGDAGAVPIEAAMKPTKQGTSTQGRSSRNFSPSLFSSMSSSSSSSSSSTKFTAMKNQSVPHGKAETEKNSSISSALSTSLANSNAVHDEAALVLSASNSFGESKRNASPAPCFEVSSASTRSSLGSTEHAQREQPSSSNEMLLFLDRPGPSTDQSNQIAMPGPSSRRSDHQSEEFTYLSLSQIDSDILKELPEDIAQEIVAGLTLQRQQRGRPNREEADRHANIQDSDRRQTRAHNDVQDEPALPSLSQLNMSCFEALPTHLQEEIRAEYAWQEKKATEKNHQNVGENYFTRLTSPRKEHKNKGTGQRGRRGRPPGKKKLSFPGNRAKNSDILKQTSKVAFIDFPGIIVCDDEDENTNDGNNFKDQENSRDCSDIIPVPQRVHKHNVQGNLYSEPHKKVEPASLCGAVTLLDVRMLIKEWLSSGPEPQSEDLTLVTEYLTRLLEQRKLDLVFSLLKLIYRNSIMSEHHSWRDCLQNLVNLIQSLMCASYGEVTAISVALPIITGPDNGTCIALACQNQRNTASSSSS